MSSLRALRRLLPHLPDLLQAIGLGAILLALYFLAAWPTATLGGGVLVLVVGTLLEVAKTPRRQRSRPGGDA